MSVPQQWSPGIYLAGQFNPLRTGCWLLANAGVGAVVEMPPYDDHERSPAEAVAELAGRENVQIRHLFCTHIHSDHLGQKTARELLATFPLAEMVLQERFRRHLEHHSRVRFFSDTEELSLGGEPLFLVEAPKHSWTDTMVIFRGAIITGDWELNTIRSVHDDKGAHSVPYEVRLESIERLIRFQRAHGYRIHKAFAVHANDRRDNIDFEALMEDTKHDRKLW